MRTANRMHTLAKALPGLNKDTVKKPNLLEYAASAPSDDYVKVGSLVNRADYPALSKLSPANHISNIKRFYIKREDIGLVGASDISKDRTLLVAQQFSSPVLRIYRLQEGKDSLIEIAYGSYKPAAHANSISISGDKSFIAFTTGNTSPFFEVAKFQGDTLIKLPNPSTLPANSSTHCRCVGVNPADDLIVVGSALHPYLHMYKKEGDLLTKLPNPATTPWGIVQFAKWSPDGTLLAINAQNGSTGKLQVYKKVGQSLEYLTELAPPAGLTRGGYFDMFWSPDGKELAVAADRVSTVRPIDFYRVDEEEFTLLANLLDFSTAPTGYCRGVGYSPDGNKIIFGIGSAPYIAEKVDGQYKTHLLQGSSYERLEYFSADGARAFIAAQTTGWNIYGSSEKVYADIPGKEIYIKGK